MAVRNLHVTKPNRCLRNDELKKGDFGPFFYAFYLT